jgi:hypothetical protein
MNPGPDRPLRVLLIHHSCGGQLLADPGEKSGGQQGSGERCLYVSHPNGGGLRTLLQQAGYEVHQASYESKVGRDTDIHHWRRKFQRQMPQILSCDRQDRFYQDGRRNDIVVFKSCYPNNGFSGPGRQPGDPDAPERTVANAQAAYHSLLPLLAAEPEVLFVAMTAPPQAEPKPQGRGDRFRALFAGKPKAARWARQFNTWLADRQDGWLADYPLPNVVVFDYYDLLTDFGVTDWSAYPTADGRDSHASRAGNQQAAAAFLPFLDQAVAAMGWSTDAAAAPRRQR